MEISEFTRAVATAAIMAQIREADIALREDISPHATPRIKQYLENLNTALDELFRIERAK